MRNATLTAIAIAILLCVSFAFLPEQQAASQPALTGAPGFTFLSTCYSRSSAVEALRVWEVASPDIACTPPPSGMVGWWPGQDNANDIVRGNNGTLVNGATFAPGLVGQAFNFDGVDDYVAIPNIVNSWPEGTLDTWVNFKDPTPKDSGDYIFSSLGTILGIHKAAGNDFVFGIYDAVLGWQWAHSGVVPNAGQWYHLGATWGPAGIEIYVDGVLMGTDPYTGPSYNSSYNSIGAAADIPGSTVNAYVDEFAIFDRALSPTEIQSIYNASSAGKCQLTCTPPSSGMVGWWPGNGNPNDIQGGNNGTLMGGATYATGEVGQAFSFDRTTNGQGVLIGNPASLQLQNFTIDAWIRRSSPDFTTSNDPLGAGGILSYGDFGYGFGMFGDGRLLLTKVDEVFVDSGSSPRVTDTNFHHVAVTKSGTSVIFYVDGVAGTPITYNATFEFTKNVSIGARLDLSPPTTETTQTSTFAGLIDEVEVFNHALSQTEIQAVYNAGYAGKCHISAFQFSADTYNVAENVAGGNATITVTRTGVRDTAANVDYATVAGGTATAGSSCTGSADYQTTTGTLSFAANEASKSFTIPICDDSTFEGNETVKIKLSNVTGTGASLGTQDNADLTIQDNESLPAVTIVSEVALYEGSGGGTTTFAFGFSLSNPSSKDVVINYSTGPGDTNPAQSPEDYTANNGTLTIPAGNTSGAIYVAVNADTKFELTEFFFVNLNCGSGCTTSPGLRGQGNIKNDDTQPTISVNDLSAAEGDSGTKNFTFNVTLSNPSYQTVNVDYVTADGTATAPSDYTAPTLTTLTFNPGVTSKPLTVVVNGDTSPETDETFVVNLSNAQNATIADSQGFATITNDDIAPTLGNYASSSVGLSSNATLVPDAAPTNTSSINVSSSTNFKGTFSADPATGVVRVTNAHPAGTHTVTVRVFNGSLSVTRNFTLTVQTGTACAGASTFTNAADSSAGTNPYSVAIGDFNNDGKQDIAAANQGSDNVSIRLGDGLGGFGGATDVSVGDMPRGVAIGDFNNDGKQDLAAANYTSDTVSIRLGDGLGGFIGTSEVSVGDGPMSVAIGDFNNDGKQDLATPNYSSDTVSIRLGDGSGGFTGTPYVIVGHIPYAVAIGDFNGDGNQDLAAVNIGSDSVSIRLGDGSGVFTGTTEVSAGIAPLSVVIGDFNNDGKQDIAAANNGSPKVSIRLGDGAGAFSGTTEVSVGFARSVAIGDFNNDGQQDIAAANYSSSTVSMRLGDGAGNFTGTTDVSVGTYPRSVAIGDFNNDGKQDFATANYNSSTVSIRLGQCTPAPTFAIDDVTHNEGDAGTTSHTFTVTKTGSTALNSSVNFTTVDGTATTADNDYQLNTGSLDFLATDTTKQITVLVNGDTTVEPDEAFTVHLTSVSNATISDADGSATITNDDIVAPTPTPTPTPLNRVATEGDGDINQTSPLVLHNPNGAMVWNGTEWVVNNTWKHQFFYDANTGQRLKAFVTTDISQSGNYFGYQVTRNVYAYSIAGKQSDSFAYQAVEYVITNTVSGKKIILRSRGSGNGAASPFFNIYIDDETSAGVPIQTTALRGDPAWFTYIGKTAEQVVDLTSDTDSRAGDLPSASAPDGFKTLDGWSVPVFNGYYLDINNGGDMGGKSYHFHSMAIASQAADLGSTFPKDFEVRWMDLGGNIQSIRFAPEVISESHITPTPSPSPSPSPSPTTLTVQFSSPTYGVTEGCVPATLTVSLGTQPETNRVANGNTVTVDYAVTGGTASQKSDYTYVAGTLIETPTYTGAKPLAGRLTFAPDETSQTIQVLINEDGNAEGPETVEVTLSNPQGTALGSPATATLTINDNETADSATNPIDEPQNFVCQQYHDFLHRQPDDAGLLFWTNQITQCGTNQACIDGMRHNVAMAFFLSIEFQQSGYFVDRLYEACLSRRPQYEEFISDLHRVGLGVEVGSAGWQQRLEDNKRQFAEQFVQRADFKTRYPDGMNAATFVDEMFEYAWVAPTSAERQAALDAFGSGGVAGRAAAMRQTMESASIYREYYNRAFVLVEYFGFLRRDPNDAPNADWAGYDFWFGKMNTLSLPGEDVTSEADAFARVKRAEMVQAFIVSSEYRQRFGRP